MSKIGIFGYFAIGKIDYGGQPIKTNSLYNALLEEYNQRDIKIVDTQEKKHILSFFLQTITLIMKSENLIILPAHNGIKYFPKIYFLIKKIFNRRSTIHYVVIGGWLPNLLSNNRSLLKDMTKFNYIYVETTVMKKRLNEMGLNNIQIMKNIKKLQPLLATYNSSSCFVFCFYSRVIPEKGVESAIEAIYKANRFFGSNVCKLHIFGPISPEYKVRLNSLIDHEVIQYKGVIDTNEASKYLSNYFMQIFPTKYYTEGIPGSIIDSFFSGLPVISSKWENVHDVIREEFNGIIYNFNDINELFEKIVWSVKNYRKVNKMRSNCIISSRQFTPSIVIESLIENIS